MELRSGSNSTSTGAVILGVQVGRTVKTFTSSDGSKDSETDDRDNRLDSLEEDIMNFSWDGSDSGYDIDGYRDCEDESKPD